MKKLYASVMMVLLLFSFMACSSAQDSTYTVERNHQFFTVDTENSTISDETNLYRYDLSKSSSGYHITITYPDNSTYWLDAQYHEIATSLQSGWSDNYDAERYVAGDTLCDVLEEEMPTQSKSKNIFVILLLIIIGIINIASPHTAWYLEYGWRFKDAEPSNWALIANRCGGILVLAIAIVMIFI